MSEPRVINLWPDGCENNAADPDRQTLTIYEPATPAEQPRAAVVVCPGGGYAGWAPYEGEPYAQLMAENGIVGIVLNYRCSPHRFPAPLADACRAIRMLRSMAGELNIDPARIGIWGSSAGGHLSAITGNLHDLHVDPHDDLAGKFSARPDRVILAYPVISMSADFRHEGSAVNLLGPGLTTDQRCQMSAELQVTPDSPPAFIFHTADDEMVPAENALAYATACAREGVTFELHVYEHGRHGVGLAAEFPKLKCWPAKLISWLSDWCQ